MELLKCFVCMYDFFISQLTISLLNELTYLIDIPYVLWLKLVPIKDCFKVSEKGFNICLVTADHSEVAGWLWSVAPTPLHE